MAGFLSRLRSKTPAGRRAPNPAAGGIGMYSEAGPPPQDPRNMLVQQIVPTLTGPPGLRLSQSNDPSESYFGTDVVPPFRFPLTGPRDVNRDIDFETAYHKENNPPDN